MSFSPDNKYLAVACDRHIKVFYNITGHRVAISDFEAKLKTSAKTQAAKERMEQAIQEHKLVLLNFFLRTNKTNKKLLIFHTTSHSSLFANRIRILWLLERIEISTQDMIFPSSILSLSLSEFLPINDASSLGRKILSLLEYL